MLCVFSVYLFAKHPSYITRLLDTIDEPTADCNPTENQPSYSSIQNTTNHITLQSIVTVLKNFVPILHCLAVTKTIHTRHHGFDRQHTLVNIT